MILSRVPFLWAFTALGALAADAPAPAPAPAPAGAPAVNGVEFTMTKGVPTEAKIADPTTLKPEDYQALRKIETLKTLNFGRGIDDASLEILSGMPSIEGISCNGMALSDKGVALLASFSKLQGFTCFHPGKDFTGTGLAALSSLPNLNNLTVAGSTLFGDEGMKAVGTLSHLQSFRTWHSGVTSEGLKSLAGLKELNKITIGQRLAYKPPATLDDDVVAVFASIPSLQFITLQEARLSLPALQKLKDLPDLKQLTLGGIDIPEADVTTLKQALPKTLVTWTAPDAGTMKRIDGIFNTAPSPATTPTTPPAKKS